MYAQVYIPGDEFGREGARNTGGSGLREVGVLYHDVKCSRQPSFLRAAPQASKTSSDLLAFMRQMI
jgi:hypothetical protein